MNFTRAVEVMEENEVDYYFSPRYQMCPSYDKISFMNSEGRKMAGDGTMCLKFIDTEKEYEIYLGTSWPFDKLGPGECIISNIFEENYNVQVGDKVVVTM